MTYKRKEIIGNATLYLGDCLEILPTLDKVDAVIKSGIMGHEKSTGCEHSEERTSGGTKETLHTSQKRKSSGQLQDEFGSALLPLSQQAPQKRVVEKAAQFVVITDPPYGIGAENLKGALISGGYSFGNDDEEYLNRVSVRAIQDCIRMFERVILTPGTRHAWNYPKPDEIGCFFNSAGAGLGKWGFTCMHPILYYGKDPHNRTRPNSFHSHAITEENGHPCPKPIKYMLWLVERASLQNDTVIDPFMGSGTTGVACMNLGRKFIGIEIEPKYFDIACSRIENAQKQLRMFE